MLLNMDISLAVNTGKTKYTEVRGHRGLMANERIRITSSLCEKVKTFKYLGSLLINKNYIHKEIKCRLQEGNIYCYSIQTLLSSRLLSKNLRIKIFKTIKLPVLLYECEAWSPTLREERRQGYLKTGSRDEYLDPRGMRMMSGEGSTMRNFIVCTVT